MRLLSSAEAPVPRPFLPSSRSLPARVRPTAPVFVCVASLPRPFLPPAAAKVDGHAWTQTDTGAGASVGDAHSRLRQTTPHFRPADGSPSLCSPRRHPSPGPHLSPFGGASIQSRTGIAAWSQVLCVAVGLFVAGCRVAGPQLHMQDCAVYTLRVGGDVSASQGKSVSGEVSPEASAGVTAQANGNAVSQEGAATASPSGDNEAATDASAGAAAETAAESE